MGRVIDVRGAFLKGLLNSEKETLTLEVPQGFRWVYDKLGDEMELRKAKGEPMKEEETMMRAKEIYKEWLSKPLMEKLAILRSEKSVKKGCKKVLLQMHRAIYGSVQAARAFWK